MKRFLSILILMIPLLSFAEDEDVTLYPDGDSEENPVDIPPKKRTPPVTPIVTIFDGEAMKVSQVPEDAILTVDIWDSVSSVFYIVTSDHEISLPYLQPTERHILYLTVNGRRWKGEFTTSSH